MNIINTRQIVLTQGIDYEFGEDLVGLTTAVGIEYDKQPDVRVNGDNDKNFFSMEYKGKKIFVARNEVDGLTVMFPDEY